MKSSNDAVDARPSWAINGRFMTQRTTGVQRYAQEIVAALDEIISDDRDIRKRLGIQLILPAGAEMKFALSQISIRQTRFGSGHAWDQLVLPWYATSGVLSLGNFGPIATRNHIVCIHDANTFIQPESYSRAFGLAYCTLLPLIGRRASRVATVSQRICWSNTGSVGRKRSSSRPMATSTRCGGMRGGPKFHSSRS